MPVIIRDIPFIARRKPRAIVSPTPPPAQELILEGAAYSKDALTLTLTFDRAISLSAFEPAAITVNDDEQLSTSFEASGDFTMATPETVVLGLIELGPSTGPGITFSATGATGIVAVNDGGTWGGAVNQALPFP